MLTTLEGAQQVTAILRELHDELQADFAKMNARMRKMRKVMVSEYKKRDGVNWKLEEKGKAFFHAFGTGYEEFKEGAGNYSTAIVEWADGTISNVPVEHVRFLDVINEGK